MRKSKFCVFAVLLAALLCMEVFFMPALANGGDYYGDEIPLETPEPTTEPTPEPSLTPEGNLTLVDDFIEPESKQFITVQSKSGNYFYIIIDRAGDTENVYFLNLVDEADLLALIDESESKAEPAPVCTCKDKCYAGHVDTSCPVCATNMSECTGKEQKPTPTATPTPVEPQPEAPKKSSAPILIVVLLLAVGGGAAYYFLKVKGKAKPKTKGTTDLDDYDYGAEDAEYEFEEYAEEEAGQQDAQEDEGT